MKYTTLANDIINILHTSSYNLSLKLYDEDGNVTTDTNNVKWCFITNKNAMIRFMDDNNSTITIWKDKDTESWDFKNINQRIRKLATLNGVSLETKLYDNLDRKMILNMVKGEMTEKENEEKSVSEAFYKLNKLCKSSIRPSDFYLSEEMKASNRRNLIENIIGEFNSLKEESAKCNDVITSLLSFNSYKDIKSIISETKNNNKEVFNIIKENIDSLKTIANFVKNCYLNNNLKEITENKIKTTAIMNNAKLYELEEVSNKDNLIKAYNHLITVSENAKCGTDILLAIKNNKLCETYRVTKNDLLDMWLSQSKDIEIKPKKVYVIETTTGEKILFNKELKHGIMSLLENINNGGKSDDKNSNNIINETLKCNSIVDFIENHITDINVKDKIGELKQIFNETIFNIKHYDTLNTLNENVDNLSYDYFERKLENKFGFSHPAIKYIAMYEALESEKMKETRTILERRDDYTLRNCLLPYVSLGKAIKYSHSIIRNKLNVFENIENNLNNIDECYDYAKKLYNNIHTVDTPTQDIVNTYLFSIINQPKSRLTENKMEFLRTIKKYIV